MNKLIAILIIFISLNSFSQTNKELKGKPKTIEECFKYFDQMFDDTSKYTFMTLPEDISISRLHHTFGMWIRNNWGLWRSSVLKNNLIDSGFVHPDDMSAILFKAYHRKLNNKPLNIKKEAQKYREFWDKNDEHGFSATDINKDHDSYTTNEELLNYFPVGDTIVVSIYASHQKFFQTYSSSVRGIAVIKEKRNKSLFVKLISIKQEKRHKTDREIGDEYEILPIYCSLIPPNDWKDRQNNMTN